jgi:nucleoside-diphosphate-sugar epimerase
VKALVLGGSVFVGRRLVRTLVAAGHDVTVLNRGRTATTLPDGVHLLTADRTDPVSMRTALASTTWDAIYDVSGFVMAAGGSDIASLLDLVDGHVGSYVFVSSIMAYDQSLVGQFPWTEDLPTNDTGPSTYGGFKAMAEAEMLARHAATGFPVTIVRPAAIYGPENNIYDMETPMFLRLLQHRPILVPHGGLVVGSYGHVDDLCDAMAAIPAAPRAAGEVLNITADGLSAARYIALLAEIVGVEPHLVPVPDDVLPTITTPVFGHLLGVRHHATLAPDKARRLLGLTPRSFVIGHRQTFEWFLAQGWADRTEALQDPVWKASWDFAAEAALATQLGGRSGVPQSSRSGPTATGLGEHDGQQVGAG